MLFVSGQRDCITCLPDKRLPLEDERVEEAGFCGSDFTLLPPVDSLHYMIAHSSINATWRSQLQKICLKKKVFIRKNVKVASEDVSSYKICFFVVQQTC